MFWHARAIATALVAAGFMGMSATSFAQPAPPPASTTEPATMVAPSIGTAPESPAPSASLPSPTAPPSAAPAPIGAPPDRRYAQRPATNPWSRFFKGLPEELPEVLPYDGEILPGYWKVRRPHQGLVIGGAVTLGCLHMFTMTAAVSSMYMRSSSYSHTVLLPVVGPFTLLVPREGVRTYGPDNFVMFMLLFWDGLGQSLGAALLLGGLATEKTFLVRKDVAAFEPELVVGPGSVGMRMRF